MENSENILQNESVQVNTPEIQAYLHETARWAKFLAIVGYIGLGLLVLISLAVIFGMSFLQSISGTGFPLALLGLVYLAIAVLYYFPVTYLYKFSIRILRAYSANDQQSLTSGFENLKSLFKFMGIFTIVILSLYALILVFMVPTLLLLNR